MKRSFNFKPSLFNYKPYLFLLPSIIIFVLFLLFPIIFAIYISFHNWDLISPMTFAGLKNWIKVLFNTVDFYRSLKNSILFTLSAAIFQTGIGLLLAILVSKIVNKYYQVISRVVFFMPVVMSVVAVSILWVWMYNPTVGLINLFLGRIGLEFLQNTWLGNSMTAMPAVLVAYIWKWSGFSMVVYLAGIQNIPKDLYESADIDGASEFKKFVHITFPLLLPQTFINVTLTTIGSLKAFDWVYIMTSGGPGGSTEVIPTLIYKTAFRFQNFGEASTISVILFILIFIVSIFIVKSFRRA